jgi:hypothetical protein
MEMPTAGLGTPPAAARARADPGVAGAAEAEHRQLIAAYWPDGPLHHAVV